MAWLRAVLIPLILPALVCANGFPHFAISREQLLSQLNSPDPQQRLSAATSLGIRREVEAVGALLEVVERPDELEAVKVEAIEALGMLRDTGVIPRLLDHLSRESVPRVRGQIVDLRGELGGEQAWSVLRTLLQTDPSPAVRGQAAIALGRLRETPAPELCLRSGSAMSQKRTRAWHSCRGSGSSVIPQRSQPSSASSALPQSRCSVRARRAP
jgi:HEAT repeat protein